MPKKGYVVPYEKRIKISNTLKGRQKTKEHLRNISLALKGKKFSLQHCINISLGKKGKTHGSPSKETIEKIRNSNIKFWSEHKELAKERGRKAGNTERGRKLPLEWVEKVAAANRGKKRKPFSEEWRRRIGLARKGKKMGPMSEQQKLKLKARMTGRPHSVERRIIERNAQIKRIERQKFDGGPLLPCIGCTEKQILDNIEKTEGIKLIRQYKIIGYFIDGYCKETNTAYEVDEPKHYNSYEELKQKDIRRQNEIEQVLGCSFVRIKSILEVTT